MSMVEDLLLSWEREGAGEKTLTASVLQAQGNWTEKVQGAVTYMLLKRLGPDQDFSLADREGSKVKSH